MNGIRDDHELLVLRVRVSVCYMRVSVASHVAGVRFFAVNDKVSGANFVRVTENRLITVQLIEQVLAVVG